jgi:hypothetical protein
VAGLTGAGLDAAAEARSNLRPKRHRTRREIRVGPRHDETLERHDIQCKQRSRRSYARHRAGSPTL